LDGRDPTTVVLSVENDGAIPPHVARDLFEPFHQGRPRAKGRGFGLGLGLYISFEIVRLHGGSIELLTPRDRTCFRVALPRTEGAPT
jgi:signal transduction histidine kinase